MTIQLTAVFRKVPEGYTGFVEEIPGTNTQGDTLWVSLNPRIPASCFTVFRDTVLRGSPALKFSSSASEVAMFVTLLDIELFHTIDRWNVLTTS